MPDFHIPSRPFHTYRLKMTAYLCIVIQDLFTKNAHPEKTLSLKRYLCQASKFRMP